MFFKNAKSQKPILLPMLRVGKSLAPSTSSSKSHWSRSTFWATNPKKAEPTVLIWFLAPDSNCFAIYASGFRNGQLCLEIYDLSFHFILAYFDKRYGCDDIQFFLSVRLMQWQSFKLNWSSFFFKLKWTTSSGDNISLMFPLFHSWYIFSCLLNPCQWYVLVISETN